MFSNNSITNDPLMEADSPSHLTMVRESKLIEEGGRNDFLTSQAGALRRQGLGYDAIRAALLIENEEKLREPLTESEVNTIAWSISKKPAAEPNVPAIMHRIADPGLGEIRSDPICLSANYTDQGNAQVFAKLYEVTFLYDHTRKKWMMLRKRSDGRWREHTNGASKRAMAHALQMRDAMARGIEDDAERARARTAIGSAENGRAMANALDKASSFLGIAISTEQFDTNIWTFNAQGTLLNLSPAAMASEKFDRPTTALDLISKSAGTKYDPEATCPLWEQFLEEIFPEHKDLIPYIQRVIGYALTGDISEQSLWVFHGDGANSKSTFLAIVQALLGDYAKATPFNTFDADNRNVYGNDIAALQGARFVPATETDSERRLSEARVKNVTGGDPVTCRFFYGEFFSYVPQFKIFLAVNHKPVIRGMDRGIWRRVKLISFTANFETNRDKHMAEKLKAELPGILNWALEGLRQWHKGGMQEPDSVRTATEEYRKESDAMGQWIQERAELGEGESFVETSGHLYADYVTWCEARKEKPSFGSRGFSQGSEGRSGITKTTGTKDPHKG